jgi:serine/threonine protein phosphatase PrpC
VCAQITTESVLGLRDAQEDRYLAKRIEGRGWLLAVFDGHNGPGTAEAAVNLVEDAFVRSIERYGAGTAAVGAAIGILREETSERVEGSSASLVHIDAGAEHAYVAVLGDSPVIVRDGDGGHVVGPVHNTMLNPEDAQRAVERGAQLVGPYLVHPERLEGVNLTRTIGDSELEFLGRTPEVLDVALGPQSFVLVGSDGLYTRLAQTPDVLVSRVAELVGDGADAAELVADALAAGSEDNVTAVLWQASDVGGA